MIFNQTEDVVMDDLKKKTEIHAGEAAGILVGRYLFNIILKILKFLFEKYIIKEYT